MEPIGAFMVLACLGIIVVLALKNRQINKEMRRNERQILELLDVIGEQKRDFRGRHPGLLEKNEALKADNQALKREVRALQDELSKTTEALKEAHRETKERPVREWQEWLTGLTRLSYEREVEVEVKFILPLVKFLGYRESDFKLRHTVHVQVGKEAKRGQADWVLWDRSKHHHQVRAVIEAKGPRLPLDRGTIEQARSYAFALDAPVYAITNGTSLKVFRRGIQADTCIADCKVGGLGEVWPKIHQEMGLGPGIHVVADK
ncbi:MAG: type I restriction enzyme HsdR N-terminal domain-containing protein [Anaerolineales bacterium]|nr:type I restriction enzyme HsdR N-terminal domain-containing protein [Anaerolineales bacterium]